jgi:hypothetical protein
MIVLNSVVMIAFYSVVMTAFYCAVVIAFHSVMMIVFCDMLRCSSGTHFQWQTLPLDKEEAPLPKL